MKKYLSLLAITMVTMSGLTHAANPRIERPIFEARLKVTSGNAQYPVATRIVMNKKDGEKYATSFVLYEDNGIRCITAPCPNISTSLFQVTNVVESKSNTVDYAAEAANGENLYVVDFGNHFLHPERKFVVTVDGTSYVGFYSPIFTKMNMATNPEIE